MRRVNRGGVAQLQRTAALYRWASSSSDRPPVAPLPNVDVGTPPPIPEGYVPIDMRSDDSISFVRDKEGKRYITGIQPDTVLHIRQPPVKNFANIGNERLNSTSVMGGQALVSPTGYEALETTMKKVPKTSDGDDPLLGLRMAPTLEPTLAARDPKLDGPQRSMFESDNERRHAAESELGVDGSSAEARKLEFEEQYANQGNKNSGGSRGNASATAAEQLEAEMERELKRIAYFEGTPKHAEMLELFKNKYFTKRRDASHYTENEISAGLVGEPVDFDRLSPGVQHHINSHHAMPFVVRGFKALDAGYHFSPLKEVGKIKMSSVDLSVASPDTVKMLNQGEDRSLAFRIFGLDVVQRHQMRFMFSDLDRDTESAFHVLRTYPYLRILYNAMLWGAIYVFYCLQQRFNMMRFYDEYLGIDLLQAPNLENPLYGFTSFAYGIMIAPLLIWGSIGINRAYRIWRRRPIGPP